MSSQIKSKVNLDIKDLSIKIAIQANIFKYIQKKKHQVSLFTNLNKKHQSIDKRIHSNQSNLISKANIQQKHNDLQPEQTFNQENIKFDCLKKINLLQRQNLSNQKDFIFRKRKKTHKSSLSDWRNLYDQRDEIQAKHRIKNTAPQKLNATDRLFYPHKKNQHLQKIQFKAQREQKFKENLNKTTKFSSTLATFHQNHQKRNFVSDENFIHMYHCSNAPILVDRGQKKRILNYLKDNKARKKCNSGLRLMNEGIFYESGGNDVNFIPYKKQSLNITDQVQKVQIVQSLSELTQNPEIGRKNELVSNSITKSKYSWSKLKVKNAKQQNYQISESPKLLDSKIFANDLSKNQSSFSYLQPNSQKKQGQLAYGDFQLKMFKQKLNKIQNGIFNAKKIGNADNRFANFQYSLTKPKLRNTFTNWSASKAYQK